LFVFSLYEQKNEQLKKIKYRREKQFTRAA